MLGRQRRDVVALAALERSARVRTDIAGRRLVRAKARFLANPLNLLLPFTAGTLGGALALHRRPVSARGEGIAWSSLLKTATTFWGLSLPVREALKEVRVADGAMAETTDPSSGIAADGSAAARPAVARTTAVRQPAPPA